MQASFINNMQTFSDFFHGPLKQKLGLANGRNLVIGEGFALIRIPPLRKEWFTCMRTLKLGGMLALTPQLGATLTCTANFRTTFTFARKLGTTLTLTLDNVMTLVTFAFTYNYSTTVTTVIHNFIVTVHFFNGPLLSTLGQLNNETNP